MDANNRNKYMGDLTSARALLMGESRSVAVLLLSNPSEGDWNNAVIEQNILQQRSSATAIRIANLLRKRIEPLGKQFLKAINEADDQTLRQLLMIAVMLRSPVIEDFMNTVLSDAVRCYRSSISKSDWIQFYEDRSKIINGLTDLSKKSVSLAGRNLITILTDGGYLDSGLNKKIQSVYLFPETKAWLIKLDKEEWISTMECKV